MPNEAVAVAVISALGGVGQQAAARKRAQQLKETGEANAQRIEEEAAEMARRNKLEMNVSEGQREAAIAASGVGGATTSLVVSQAERENARQLEWLADSAAKQAQISRESGIAGAEAEMTQAMANWGSILTDWAGAGGGGQMLSNMYNEFVPQKAIAGKGSGPMLEKLTEQGTKSPGPVAPPQRRRKGTGDWGFTTQKQKSRGLAPR